MNFNTLVHLEHSRSISDEQNVGMADASLSLGSPSNGSFALMSAAPLALRPRPQDVQLQQFVQKSHPKSHEYVKKKIVVEKLPLMKERKGEFVDVKIKYKDGEWTLKQSSQKVKF